MFSLHLLWFICCLVSFLGGIKLYISYQKTGEENLGYFYKIFVFVGLLFAFNSLPGILEDPSLVQACYIFAWVFVLSASFLGLKVVSNIWDLPKIKKIATPVALVSIIIFSALSVLYFTPSKIMSFGNYWYWREEAPLWLRASGAVIVGISALLTGLLFLIGGLKSKDKAILNRSFLMGGGFIILTLQALAAYPFYDFSFTFVLFTAFYSVLGLAMIYFGIHYKLKR